MRGATWAWQFRIDLAERMAQTLPKYMPAQAEAIARLDVSLQIIAYPDSGKDGASDWVPSADHRLAEVPHFDGVGEVGTWCQNAPAVIS